MTLAQLHDVLQIAMGWEDGHMHEFRVGQRRFGQPEPADPIHENASHESERTARLSAVLGRTGAKMIYTYDFGDSWEHSIVLEKQLPADSRHDLSQSASMASSPARPKTAAASPDFMNLLDALADPKHEQHEEMRDWIGDDFDPQAFSVDSVNRKLAPKRRRSSATKN